MLLESKRDRRLRKAIEAPFPADWTTLLETRWGLWHTLSNDEQGRLADLVKGFVADKRWEAAQGFEVTEAIKVLIAAQACLLILELEHDFYRASGSIIVHPSTVVLQGQRATDIGGMVSDGPFPIVGQAQHRGSIIISWDAARFDARHPGQGHNVVIHEFAHNLDMLDGVVDGTPPLPDETARKRWIRVCTTEYRALKAGTSGGLLDVYGATNPGEFFAVATEVFFTRGEVLAVEKPELYEILQGFYRQDPASRGRSDQPTE